MISSSYLDCSASRSSWECINQCCPAVSWITPKISLSPNSSSFLPVILTTQCYSSVVILQCCQDLWALYLARCYVEFEIRLGYILVFLQIKKQIMMWEVFSSKYIKVFLAVGCMERKSSYVTMWVSVLKKKKRAQRLKCHLTWQSLTRVPFNRSLNPILLLRAGIILVLQKWKLKKVKWASPFWEQVLHWMLCVKGTEFSQRTRRLEVCPNFDSTGKWNNYLPVLQALDSLSLSHTNGGQHRDISGPGCFERYSLSKIKFKFNRITNNIRS